MVPKIKTHFEKLELPDEVWIGKWIQTLYTIYLPLNFTIQVWDCLMLYGLRFIISFSISIVEYFEKELIILEDAFDVVEFFKNVFLSERSSKNFEEIIKKAIQNMEGILIPSSYISNSATKYSLNKCEIKPSLRIEQNNLKISVPAFSLNLYNKDSPDCIEHIEEVNDINSDCIEEEQELESDITLNVSSHIMTPRNSQR